MCQVGSQDESLGGSITKLASLDLEALLRTFEFIHYAQNNA